MWYLLKCLGLLGKSLDYLLLFVGTFSLFLIKFSPIIDCLSSLFCLLWAGILILWFLYCNLDLSPIFNWLNSLHVLDSWCLVLKVCISCYFCSIIYLLFLFSYYKTWYFFCIFSVICSNLLIFSLQYWWSAC
jgi:hypothetical protein